MLNAYRNTERETARGPWYLAGMRNAVSVARRRAGLRGIIGMAMGLAGCAAMGQSGPPTEMPKDPVSLLNLAASSNGLGGSGMKPWRLKASFEAFDEQGEVSVQGTIGKDGRIANLRVISGPEELRGAALDAVKRWVYRPYLLNGQPVSVDTTINVAFNLGRR